MQFTGKDHTFALCAYQESEYLEECILSLRAQRVKSRIIVCTSTPNAHISGLAEKYGLPLCVNDRSGGIASDWNFAFDQVKTPLMTIAHQDDIYEPAFLEKTLEAINQGKEALICFTDYFEIQDGQRVYAKDFLNLRIKRWMQLPLRSVRLQNVRWIRRRMLSIGDPICCPSVTYVKKNLPEHVFEDGYKAVLDWQTWEKLSRMKGRFVYVSQPLMGHRMHAKSTTMKLIGDHDGRTKEDLEILKMFWPKPVAKLICRLYSRSQKTR